MVRLDPSTLPFFRPRLFYRSDELDGDTVSQFDRSLSGLQEGSSSVDGSLYALPFDVAVQTLFYHKSIFEDIGQSRAFYERTRKSLVAPDSYEDFDHVGRFSPRYIAPDLTMLGEHLIATLPEKERFDAVLQKT